MRVRRRPYIARLRQGERGAVGTIVAVLLLGGVVMGMLALTVDVGNIWLERRQLQNAADATAMALAKTCAASSTCDPTSVAAVADLLGKNSFVDQKSQFDKSVYPEGACGRGVALDNCDPARNSAANLARCPELPSWLSSSTTKYVETYAKTETASSGDRLLPWFGDKNAAPSEVACARAAWGPAGGTGPTLPMTLGLCDWMNATQVGGVSGRRYAPEPPYSSGPGTLTSPAAVPSEVASYVIGIFTHDSTDHKCLGSPGQDYPGGFGFLDGGSNCQATIMDGDLVAGDTGASVPTSCQDRLKTYLGQEVSIPIYDTVSGTGSGAQFHVSGIAYFYLAGYVEMPSANRKTEAVYVKPSSVCASGCNGSVSYIWGWFTSGLLPANSVPPGTGPDRGVRIVAPAG